MLNRKDEVFSTNVLFRVSTLGDNDFFHDDSGFSLEVIFIYVSSEINKLLQQIFT